MEATASVKCPHCEADLQEYGVLEIQASGVDVDAEGRIAYEAKRRPLDEVEGYVCSVCNGRLDFEDDPVAEYTQMRVPEDVSLVDDSVAEVRDDIVYSLRMNGEADAATLRNWIARLNALVVCIGGEACGIDLDGIEKD